jgi:hypothetical protein
MTDTATKFYEGQPGTSDGSLYGGSATGGTILHIHACNTTGLPATLSIAVNCSATADAAHAILWAYTLPPNGTYDLTGMIQLDANATTGTIRGLQGTASAITLVISGNAIT